MRASGQVFAYALLYPEPGEADPAAAGRAASRILSSVLALGLDTLTAGRPALLPFTRALLCAEVPPLPAPVLMPTLPASVGVDDEVVAACARLAARGYAVCLDGFLAGGPLEALLPHARYLQVDARRASMGESAAVAALAAAHRLQLMARGVESHEVAQRLHEQGYQLFQGRHLATPTPAHAAPGRAAALAHTRVLRALNRPGLTVSHIEDVVKDDPVLTYRVLRAINSPAFALHTEVASIRQAVVMLGQERVRKWLMIWALAGVNDGAASELLAAAVLRARCCEELGASLDEDSGSFFLLGLCSLLDAILRRPMQDVIADLPLSAPVRDALLGGSGRARRVLDTVVAYEQGEWGAAREGTSALGVPFRTLAVAYADALRWARALQPDAEVAA